MSSFQIGDAVRKITGYPFAGKVAAVYPDEPKCSVRHADGWDHIFHDKQLDFDLPEYQYLDLLRMLVAKAGDDIRPDRTGTGTYSVFGRQIRFDLRAGFPLLTTKKVAWRPMVAELVWFLRGLTNTDFLHERGCTIWDEWADEKGELGPVYGYQWRSWPKPYNTGAPIDQLGNVIQSIRNKPHDRGHVVSAWNVADLPHMALRPCHCLFQFYVEGDRLSCQLYQRSADIFLGVPFNIASYALLTHVIAREVGLNVGEFVHTFGDLHLYSNHVEQAQLQLARMPYRMPQVEINPSADLRFDQLDVNDFALHDYVHHPAIKAAVAV